MGQTNNTQLSPRSKQSLALPKTMDVASPVNLALCLPVDPRLCDYSTQQVNKHLTCKSHTNDPYSKKLNVVIIAVINFRR